MLTLILITITLSLNPDSNRGADVGDGSFLLGVSRADIQGQMSGYERLCQPRVGRRNWGVGALTGLVGSTGARSRTVRNERRLIKFSRDQTDRRYTTDAHNAHSRLCRLARSTHKMLPTLDTFSLSPRETACQKNKIKKFLVELRETFNEALKKVRFSRFCVLPGSAETLVM